jgi:cysteate synthase
MTTGTFKECEAFTVCARMPDDFDETLVVASAGNTARAFIRVCSENQIPLVVVVPEGNLSAIWGVGPIDPCVRLVTVGGGADYYDAIDLASMIAGHDGFVAEGGAKNVARRDGMGTTVLSAVTTIGRVPDYYFQAVGSGTGAIAAWEANQRFRADGRFGDHMMKLMLSQNAPFLTIHDSWKQRSRTLVEVDPETARARAEGLFARVLSNRKPPYAVRGGLYDALAESDGEVFAVSNEEAIIAGSLFEKSEGIDITPAASVAVGSLIQAKNNNRVSPSDTIMLNITGGGVQRLARERPIHQLEPAARVDRADMTTERVAELVDEIRQAPSGRDAPKAPTGRLSEHGEGYAGERRTASRRPFRQVPR